MEVFDLDAAPTYTTLSYKWDSLSTEHVISINGCSSMVSDDLFYFLKPHPVEEYDEYLWIDQICIAQSDTMERNHQSD